MRRTLHLPGTDQMWVAEQLGTRVVLRSGVKGRERTSEHPFSDSDLAERYLREKEWARLKKGYVLFDPEASAGNPRLHRFLAHGYTGALIAAEVGGRFLTNRPVETETKTETGAETLIFVDENGRIDEGCILEPETLAWRAVEAATDQVLVLADRRVLAWSPQGGTPTPLTENDPGTAAGFLSVAGALVAWYDAPDVVVRDLETGEDRLRIPVAPELYGGHTMQMEGALSPDGCTIALCTEAGRIRLVDLGTGKQRAIGGEFAMIERLLFTPDGTILFALERYDEWRLFAFDLSAIDSWRKKILMKGLNESDLAIDAAGTRLAVASGKRVSLYRLPEVGFRSGFEIEHAVRRSAIAWVGPDTIGVRTDLGCASLYGTERMV